MLKLTLDDENASFRNHFTDERDRCAEMARMLHAAASAVELGAQSVVLQWLDIPLGKCEIAPASKWRVRRL